MRNKRVPFYAEMKQGKTAFTLFIDPVTKEVYRANHKAINQVYYWVAFALVLAILRALKGVPLSYDSPFYLIVFTLATVCIGLGIGISFYKGTSDEFRQMELSSETIKEYMVEGKRYYRNELIMTGIVLACAILFTILFLVYLSLIWLFFTFTFFLFSGSLLCNVSIIRYQILYQDKLKFMK